MRRRCAMLVLLAGALLAFPLKAEAMSCYRLGSDGSKDIFVNLPKGRKGSLQKRLLDFIDAVRCRRTNELSEMLGDYYVSGGRERLGKMNEEIRSLILDNLQSIPISSFSPTSILFEGRINGPELCTVRGCGQYLADGAIVSSQAAVIAYFVDNDWYFVSLSSLQEHNRVPCQAEGLGTTLQHRARGTHVVQGASSRCDARVYGTAFLRGNMRGLSDVRRLLLRTGDAHLVRS